MGNNASPNIKRRRKYGFYHIPPTATPHPNIAKDHIFPLENILLTYIERLRSVSDISFRLLGHEALNIVHIIVYEMRNTHTV